MRPAILAALAVALPAALVGCGGDTAAPRTTAAASPTPPSGATISPAKPTAEAPDDEVAAERAKLSPEDRALVDAQEWCVVNTEGQLGSMGAPVKLTIKGQPVFLCCAGCKRRAEADPDKTLATLEELKRKAKAAKTQKG